MKRLIYFTITLFASLAFINNVYAASGSISVTTSSKTVLFNSTFNVTIKVTCSETIGSWQFNVDYDKSVLSLQSGDLTIADFGDGKIKTKSYTYKFKAKKAGNANIKVLSPSMVTWNNVDNLFTPSVSNASVTVKTQAQIEASYSKDNNLKSLSLTGFEISPAFNKDTLEYTVEVPDDTETVTVNAKVADANASVRGIGSIDVSEGTNKIEVVVTAQNGSTKTYTIVVTVKDLHPIEVTIDSKKYLVVKKGDLLTTPSGFTLSTIKIDGLDIPAYTSEIVDITLIGLKDEDGKIDLYQYDEGKYSLYNEVKSSSITLLPLTSEIDIKGFTKDKITLNDQEYDAYKNDTSWVIYGMDIETGKKDYFLYDKEYNVFTKYDIDDAVKTSEELNDTKLYLYVLITISSILLIISVVTSRKNAKLKKLLIKFSDKMKLEEKDEESE